MLAAIRIDIYLKQLHDTTVTVRIYINLIVINQ